MTWFCDVSPIFIPPFGALTRQFLFNLFLLIPVSAQAELWADGSARYPTPGQACQACLQAGATTWNYAGSIVPITGPTYGCIRYSNPGATSGPTDVACGTVRVNEFEPEKNNGLPEWCTGNPINFLTGNKYQEELDYSDGRSQLAFYRYYKGQHTVGDPWGFSYSQKLVISSFPTFESIALHRDDGKILHAELMYWETEADLDPDVKISLEKITENQVFIGWRVTTQENTEEIYDTAGNLIEVNYISSRTLTLSYDASGRLESVMSDLGPSITLGYDPNGRLDEMTDPDGNVYGYAYDTQGRLIDVTYPGSGTPTKTYHYEDSTYLNALTGITDENGNRLSTWTYDDSGHAINSTHTAGVDNVSVDYSQIASSTDPRITVTNALGKQTTYHYKQLFGVRRVDQVEGHASANCAAANQNYTYDANGFLGEVTDWKGYITDYDHDARGLEVQRIEAKGTPEQRSITTQWHADFRLPTKITEPDRIVEFTYDTAGLLLERKETPIAP